MNDMDSMLDNPLVNYFFDKSIKKTNRQVTKDLKNIMNEFKDVVTIYTIVAPFDKTIVFIKGPYNSLRTTYDHKLNKFDSPLFPSYVEDEYDLKEIVEKFFINDKGE